MKYTRFKRYKFSTIVKNINTIRYKLIRIFKFTYFTRYDFRKIYKYLDFRRYNFYRIDKKINFKNYKYLDFRRYNFYRIDKKINFKNYKYLPIYFFAFFILFGFIYVSIPIFYSYDKSNIEKTICNNQGIECLIKGKVNYSFYPTPRIKIKDLIIKDFFKKSDTLATIEDVEIKLSINNLLNKNKQNFEKIEIKNFEINVDLKKYKNISTKKFNFIPVAFTKGKIIFFDGKNYIATINDINLNLILEEASMEAILKGRFLNDNIYINFNSKQIDHKRSTDIIFKMSKLSLLMKANLFNSKKDKNTINGNILLKKNKHRFTTIFDYKGGEITFNKSNLTSAFLNGKLEGKVTTLPYLNFDLDLDLNKLNFTKLYTYFLTLDEKRRKNLFKINNKINGKLNFSANKVHSRYNLIKSFESRIKFYNGNISIEQLLLDLGKLGAADVLGTINNDKKFTKFNFESNIFIDNKKKILNKFGIYNKSNISSNIFISGNFDLENVRTSFYEISGDKKFNNEDINYIEQEFNNLMLDDGYTNLFNFLKFKEFVKSITDETN